MSSVLTNIREAILAGSTIEASIFNSSALSSVDYVEGAWIVVIHPTYAEVYNKGVLKEVSHSTLHKIVNRLHPVEDALAEPILPPANCFSIQNSSDEIHIDLYYPERIADIQYDKKGSVEVHKIPLPNVIIRFHLRKTTDDKWSVAAVKYCCTPLTLREMVVLPSSGDTATCKVLPLPNIYGSGAMCYGRNSVPQVFNNDLRGLAYYYDLLTLAPFNGDLSIVGVRGYTPYQWIAHLSTLTEFPYSEISN